MKFDMQKFNTANFTDRQKKIPVKNETLAGLFMDNGSEAPTQPGEDPPPKGQPCVVVKGLGAIEMALAKEQVDNSRSREQIINAIFGTVPTANLEAIKKLAGVISYDSDGVPEELPADYVRRLFYLLHGCVEPKFTDQQQVIRFAKAFPIEFHEYTNEIIRLSGLGMELGE